MSAILVSLRHIILMMGAGPGRMRANLEAGQQPIVDINSDDSNSGQCGCHVCGLQAAEEVSTGCRTCCATMSWLNLLPVPAHLM